MINVSETAAAKINELLTEENKAGSGLRVFVQGGGCSGFQYGLMIEENGQGSGDQVFESHGVKLFIDPISIRYLSGAEVDFSATTDTSARSISSSASAARRRVSPVPRYIALCSGWSAPASPGRSTSARDDSASSRLTVTRGIFISSARAATRPRSS